jgi:hypothetical protein
MWGNDHEEKFPQAGSQTNGVETLEVWRSAEVVRHFPGLPQTKSGTRGQKLRIVADDRSARQQGDWRTFDNSHLSYFVRARRVFKRRRRLPY